MTTTIILSMIEPMCELFYKNQKTVDIKMANDNTFRNYGFSTSYAINFGFELPQTININDLQIQPGVFSLENQFQAYPDINVTTSIDLVNNIVLQDLPPGGIGTVSYENKVLPIKISLHQGVGSILGIASAIINVPYDNQMDISSPIIRDFESNLFFDPTLSMLVFVNFENVEITGVSTNWSASPTSLYNTHIHSYRYNNGYGQFYSYNASRSFIHNTVGVSTSFTQLENITYMNVYNWVNLLDWEPDFESWYTVNKSLVPDFTQKFLLDYFNVS